MGMRNEKKTEYWEGHWEQGVRIAFQVYGAVLVCYQSNKFHASSIYTMHGCHAMRIQFLPCHLISILSPPPA
jgi:hypothetical protein